MITDQSVNTVDDKPPAAPTRRLRRPEDRARELVEAATRLFVERGFAATKLDDVARAAGVSKGLTYNYFRGKDALFKAVIGAAILGPLGDGEQIVASFDGPSKALLRIVLEQFRVFEEGPAGGVLKLVVSEAGNFPDVARYFMDEVDRRGRDLFAAILRRGVERGEFRAIADIQATVIVMISPLSMYSIWKRSLGPHDPDCLTPDAFYATHAEFILRGLRP